MEIFLGQIRELSHRLVIHKVIYTDSFRLKFYHDFTIFEHLLTGKYHGPGKGLASRACNWYIHSRNGYRISMNIEFFSVEGDPASNVILLLFV